MSNKVIFWPFVFTVESFPDDDPTEFCQFTAFQGYKSGMTHIVREVDKPGSSICMKNTIFNLRHAFSLYLSLYKASVMQFLQFLFALYPLILLADVTLQYMTSLKMELETASYSRKFQYDLLALYFNNNIRRKK